MINKIKAELHFYKGEKQANQGLLEESIHLFNKAISFNPLYSGIYLHKALSLSRKKKYAEAIQTLKKAIELKPSNPAFQLFLGIIYYDCRNYDEALNAFEKNLVISPDNILSLSYKNLVLLITGKNTKEAGDFLRKNIKHTNYDFQSRLLEFCETYCLKNRKTEKPVDILHDLYNEELEINSSTNYFDFLNLKLSAFCHNLLYFSNPDKKSAYMHYIKGMRSQLTGNIDTAIEEYKEALKIDKEFNDAADKLIELYWDKRNYDYVLENIKQIPVYSEILSLMNKLISSKKEDKSKERDIMKNMHLIFMLAYAYFQIGKYDSALEIFTLLSKYDHQNPIVFYCLALCYLLKNNHDEARIAFQKSIKKLDQRIIENQLDETIELLINKDKR